MSKTKKAWFFCCLSTLLNSIGPLNPLIAQTKSVEAIELRNYAVKPGNRDKFISYFEKNFIDSLNGRGNLVLGQYTVKNFPESFFWIRGFESLASRTRNLNDFYSSQFWSTQSHVPRTLLLNYENVQLLKPMAIDTVVDVSGKYAINNFGKKKGIAVIDYYIAKNKKEQFVSFVRQTYDSLLRAVGIKDISFWVSAVDSLDKDRPDWEDRDLVVSISYYKSEEEYSGLMKKLQSRVNEEIHSTMLKLVTTKWSLILTPTAKSFLVKQ